MIVNPTADLVRRVAELRLLVDLARGDTVSRRSMLTHLDDMLATYKSNCADEHNAELAEQNERERTAF